MNSDKKLVFVLGACCGTLVTVSGIIATKLLNKVFDDKIDNKLSRNSYNHCTFNQPFGCDTPFGVDESFFGNDFDRDSKLDSDKDLEEDTDNNIFFESED